MINSSHKELSQTLQPYSLTLELKTESDKIKKITVPFQSLLFPATGQFLQGVQERRAALVSLYYRCRCRADHY